MKKEVAPMESVKNVYIRPQLIKHGTVDEITQTGGSTTTDVPDGTPVNGDIGNVAS